jgi:UDP-GlcNAc:undecaprenyl-phosphate GlcNAc-1-phosphate transferase
MPVALVVPAGTGLAMVVTLAVAVPVRRMALWLDLTDRPSSRKAHQRPTPYLGGVAVILGCLLPLVLLVRPWSPHLVAIAVAGLFIAGLGLTDDIRTLSVGTRLAAETMAATAVTLTAHPLVVAGVPWLDTIVTVAWIVVMTNSFNLLDNMDAAAASVGTATAGVLGLSALLAGRPAVGLLLLFLAGGCVGFLVHNRPPARIFMGDTGSLFIGFVLATAAVLCVPSVRGGSYAALLLVTFVATVDTTLVVIDRRRNGRPWHLGGTDHVSHRLHRLGLSTGQVAAVLFLAAAASTALSGFVAAGAIPGWPAFGAGLLGVATAVALLLNAPVREHKPS